MIGQMTVQELKQAMESEEITVIDCREQDEWDSGHVPGAEFLPLSDFENQAAKLNDPEAKIAIICRSGKRSLSACQFLSEEKNFANLFNVTGGTLAWIDEDYPVEK